MCILHIYTRADVNALRCSRHPRTQGWQNCKNVLLHCLWFFPTSNKGWGGDRICLLCPILNVYIHILFNTFYNLIITIHIIVIIFYTYFMIIFNKYVSNFLLIFLQSLFFFIVHLYIINLLSINKTSLTHLKPVAAPEIFLRVIIKKLKLQKI